MTEGIKGSEVLRKAQSEVCHRGITEFELGRYYIRCRLLLLLQKRPL